MSKKHDGYKDGLVEDYVSDFDLYNNDTSNVYTPTAYERAMITEAMHGFVANHWPDVWEIRAAALDECARAVEKLIGMTSSNTRDPEQKMQELAAEDALVDAVSAIRALKDKEPDHGS